MDSFYRKWLIKNESENKKAKELLKKNSEEGTNLPNPTSNSSVPSPSNLTNPIPSTSSAQSNLTSQRTSSRSIVHSPSDLIYENDKLKLIVEKANHIKQSKSNQSNQNK